MDRMSLNSKPILDAIVSHAARSGYFEKINTVEPKAPPGNGLTCAIWTQHIGRAVSSGASSTSGYLIFTVRLFSNMLQEPQGQIDPNMMVAVDALVNAYQADFTLDGLVRAVDLLGMEGQALEANAGYVTINNVMFRTFDITLPLIINDVWDQVA